MERLANGFYSHFTQVAKKFSLDWKRLSVSRKLVYEIIERVEQRRVYFHIFHKDIKGMGEANECALYCFWILKLMPFHYADDAANGKINQALALDFMVSTLKGAAEKEKKVLQITKKKYENLFYAFCYRDLSKEAIMALAETLIC
jgi:hypothetical protein